MNTQTQKKEKEGLHINNNGYFYSTWDIQTKSHIIKKLSLQEIETHLNSIVTIDYNTRLKDILIPIIDSSIFAIVYKREFWDGFVQEIKQNNWKEYPGDQKPINDIDGNEIEYLELYGAFDYFENQVTNEKTIYNLPSHFNFHGVGFPIISQAIAHEYSSFIGEVMSYSISFNPIHYYMNYPVKIGQFTFSKTVLNINDDYKRENIISNTDIPVSLSMLIYSILWDMSFYGLGDARDSLYQSLN